MRNFAVMIAVGVLLHFAGAYQSWQGWAVVLLVAWAITRPCKPKKLTVNIGGYSFKTNSEEN